MSLCWVCMGYGRVSSLEALDSLLVGDDGQEEPRNAQEVVDRLADSRVDKQGNKNKICRKPSIEIFCLSKKRMNEKPKRMK